MKQLVAAVLLLCALPALAAEHILSYDSDITVRENGSMLVTETIRVRAENRKINRGIYRDYPTEYRTSSGTKLRVDFRIVEIERDGQPEAFHTKRLSNGIRVYIGRKAVTLNPGVYSYRISYVTDRQLGFFEEHDELYWNVTGNGWDFPIESASARVNLPDGISSDAVRMEAYTGRKGARGRDYQAQIVAGLAEFKTTAPLKQREGMTIVVAWPKGFVREPTWQDRLEWRWRDDPAVFVVWIGSLGLFLYYLFAWHVVGRDPKPGVVIPEYEPPKGYPPAALRMVRRMGWDDKALSAALVGLAVKGALTLSENDDQYSVSSTGKDVSPLSAGEKAILHAVGGGTLVFKSSNHARVKKLRDAHREQLEGHYEKRYFYSNRGWMVMGWLLTAVVVGFAAIGFVQTYGPRAFFVFFFGMFISFFALPFLKALWALREPAARIKSNWMRLLSSGFSMVVCVFMFGGGMLQELGKVIPWSLALGVVFIASINVVFNELVKAPTKLGRKLLDNIDGFRDYLSIAESDELRFKYARPVTPETFEAYLPYAIALDVETQWSERFAAALRAQGQEPSQYSTSWYNGHSFSGVRGLSSSVGSSLASTVSSSSQAPGSSSGFSGGGGGGGGGSSGGGGGGGGGGGW